MTRKPTNGTVRPPAASHPTDSWRSLGRILGRGEDQGLLARIRYRKARRVRLQAKRQAGKPAP